MKSHIVILLILSPLGLAIAQENNGGPTLEQRQPLELVFADSIVPQDLHEAMFTTGAWNFRRGSLRDSYLTQKIEWGISDTFQISTTLMPVRRSNSTGRRQIGVGDVEVGARYTWEHVRSPFTHVALAFDAGLPTGNPNEGMGEGAYTVSPSILLSHEFRGGKLQLFSTSGAELIAGTRRIMSTSDDPHHVLFSNDGISVRAGHGWVVSEFSVDTNRWAGGNETHSSMTPSYIWRLARRTELLLGVPIGLSSSTDHIGGVVKFTFELGGKE
jgi:hypothetical protein